MDNAFVRTELLIGTDALKKLNQCKVAVFGIGGVGGFVVEGLARCGVGQFVLVDADDICITNLNRQIIATTKTIGQSKVEVARERILDINPKAKVDIYKTFYLPDRDNKLIRKDYHYIIDAVDTISAKVDIIFKAKQLGVPVISSMGMGNKIDPTKIEVNDIYKTSVCPLAKIMRKELKKIGIDSLKVVYSKEEPLSVCEQDCDSIETEEINCNKKVKVLGSIFFVPSVAGLIIAGEVIKDLIK